MFFTVHTFNPTPIGIDWAALLYICCYLAINSYTNGPYDLNHSEGLSVGEFQALCAELGRTGCRSDPETQLMMAARKWSRLERHEVEATLSKTWRLVADDPKVRFVVEGMLWPCDRAYLLF